jgi:hypothetical protein
MIAADPFEENESLEQKAIKDVVEEENNESPRFWQTKLAEWSDKNDPLTLAMIASDPSEKSKFPIQRKRESVVKRETAEQPSVPETLEQPSVGKWGQDNRWCIGGSITSMIQRKGEPVSEETAEEPSVPETVEKP